MASSGRTDLVVIDIETNSAVAPGLPRRARKSRALLGVNGLFFVDTTAANDVATVEPSPCHDTISKLRGDDSEN